MYKEFKDYESYFAERLGGLRTKKGVSAREMSLSIGVDKSYVNSIENKHALPSLRLFFAMCDYLEITPKEFFDDEAADPQAIRELIEILKRNDEETTDAVLAVARKMDKHSDS